MNGLSTDIKPTVDIPSGMEFFETDTGKRYIYRSIDGGSTLIWDNSDDLLDTKRSYLSAGVVGTLPTFTDNGNGSCNIGGCIVNLFDNSTFTGKLLQYSLSAVTNISVTDGTTKYITASYNAGTPIISSTTDFSTINHSSVIVIYVVNRIDSVIYHNDFGVAGIGLSNKEHYTEIATRPIKVMYGLTLSESPTRAVSISAGAVSYGLEPITLSAFSSASNRLIHYYPVAGVWTHSDVTQYSNTQYSNGTDLATLTDGNYGVHHIFRSVLNGVNVSYIIDGSTNGTLQQVQQASINPVFTSLPSVIQTSAVYVGHIAFIKGATSSTQVKTYSRYGVEGESGNMELTTNKVTSFNSPTDVQYPSAKLVSDQLNAITLGQAVTVGTGGQYANIGAAVAAGKYNLIVISNITETANIALTTSQNLYINGFLKYTVNLSSYSFTTSIANLSVFINNLVIVNNSYIINSAQILSLFLNNCTINTSTNTTLSFSYYANVIAEDCSFTLPNTTNAWTNDPITIPLSKMNRCTFVGGGTSCDLSMRCYTGATTSKSSYNNIILTGTFNKVQFGGETTNVSGNATITQYRLYSFGGDEDSYQTNIHLKNAILVSGLTEVNKLCGVVNGVFSSISYSSDLNVNMFNVKFLNDSTINSSSYIKLSHCQLGVSGNTKSLTIGSTSFGISIIDWTVYGTITNSGSKNIISNCFIGVSGGTTKTITLSSGASYNTIENCVFEIAPVDNSGNYTNTFRNNRLWDGTPLPDFTPTGMVKMDVATTLSNGSTYVVNGKYDIQSIVVEALTTTAGNISIGSSAGLSDIVAVTALPTTIGAKRQLIYIINSNYPNGSDRTMYITISSAATVKLYTNQLRMI